MITSQLEITKPYQSHTRAMIISKGVTINKCVQLPGHNIKHFLLYNLQTTQANDTEHQHIKEVIKIFNSLIIFF